MQSSEKLIEFWCERHSKRLQERAREEKKSSQKSEIMFKRIEKVWKMAKKWIAEAIKKPGALHKKLGVPKGKKIPAKMIKKAEKSKSPTLRKEANLAETLGKMRKKR